MQERAQWWWVNETPIIDGQADAASVNKTSIRKHKPSSRQVEAIGQ